MNNNQTHLDACGVGRRGLESRSLSGRPSARRSFRRGSVAKVGLTVAILALVGTVGFLVLRPKPSDAARAGTTTSDRAPVTKVAFDITTTASGELEARNQIEIRNKLDSEAIITEVVAEGKTVKAGDVIVQFNSEKITDALNDQQLAVEGAKAESVASENSYSIQVIENTSKTRQAQLKVDLAELALQQWLEGDVKTKRQKLETDREKADLELQRLAEKLIQSQKLHEQGFLSKDERDRDEVSYIEACSAWVTADLDAKVYENYEFPKDQKSKLSDVEEAKAELARVKLNNEIELASKDAARSKSRQQLALREQRLAKLKQDLENCTINAPSDGLVVYASSLERGRGMMFGGGDGPMQIGRKVYPNELVMVLPDTSEMVASVRVQESLAGRVRPGQAATLKIDAAGGRTFVGKVDSIGILAETGGWRDPNLREYTVKIAMATEAGHGLKPSMRCEAELTLDQVPETLTIPVQAVFNDGAVNYVYTEAGPRFKRVPVQLGRRSSKVAEIVKGLSEGERVLVREPTPGEVLAQPWAKADLEAVGYIVGEDGQPMGPQDPSMRGGRPGGKQGGQSGKNGDKAGNKPGAGDAVGQLGKKGTKGEGSAKADATPGTATAEKPNDTGTVQDAGKDTVKDAAQGVETKSTETTSTETRAAETKSTEAKPSEGKQQ